MDQLLHLKAEIEKKIASYGEELLPREYILSYVDE